MIGAIGLKNRIVGHAYLVDGKGYIRWRATALPTQRELQTMIKCTKQLMAEKKKQR
ncbi:MAG: mitochondrial ATPase complex subunit ATP10 [Proteobacteria bacterium]|nr:mitochondrial ATPase complex subunit ATP10 [Pseudomonadota bacterium]